MQIFVRTLRGRAAALDVDADSEVRRVKEQLEEREGIPVCEQRLLYAGLPLRDNCGLAESGIIAGSTLQLALRLHGGGLQLLVKIVGGQTVTVDAELTDTIKDIKMKIQGKTGILATQQSLIFAAKQLDDTRTVADYNLHGLHRPLYLVRWQGLDGCWRQGSQCHVIRGNRLHWSTGKTSDIQVVGNRTLTTVVHGASFEARLNASGQQLAWSDGDVWVRAMGAGPGIRGGA
mmetsp:Transcript_51684/g.102767  ORF Transcript_51684/g.102767 Transcript_51684/m.102767 type:complete len:232 (-) Transcript_51684:25-720(-)